MTPNPIRQVACGLDDGHRSHDFYHWEYGRVTCPGRAFSPAERAALLGEPGG